MGRQQKTLIKSRFHRGEKRDDASNRYAQTCRECGIHFPKGRMDTLVNHLVGSKRRCTKIKAEEVPGMLDILGNTTVRKSRRKPASGGPDDPIYVESTRRGSRRPGPDEEGRGLTGLEALAEASRQVERPPDPDLGPPTALAIDPNLAECEERVRQALGQYRHLAVPARATMLTLAAASMEFSVETALTSSHDLPSIAASASNLEASLPDPHGANRLVESTAGEFSASPPFRSASTWHAPASAPFEVSPDTIARAATYPRAIAANLISPTHDSDESNTRLRKGRKGFSDERRKEVEEVRKKGACLRCRMLRKPVIWQYAQRSYREADERTVLTRRSLLDVREARDGPHLEDALHANPARAGI